jgi:glucoamylase
VADLPTMELRAGNRVKLTFHWRDADRWEGSDFLVCIE